MIRYRDFDIRINYKHFSDANAPLARRRYTVNVRFFEEYQRGQRIIHDTEHEMTLPFSEEELHEKMQEVIRGLYNTSEIYLDQQLEETQPVLLPLAQHEPQEQDLEEIIQQIGEKLFNALFTRSVYANYQRAKANVMHSKEERLRIRLTIRDDELAALPWEIMYDPEEHQYLCHDRIISLARYIGGQHISSIETRLPLQILGMIALSDEELSAMGSLEDDLSKMFSELADKASIEYIEQNWQALQNATQAHQRIHIFHFLGHGGFDQRKRQGFITLKEHNGLTNNTFANDLGSLLRDQKLRLVVLNTCEGARGSDVDRFSSTAATLARLGTPAVVAMQYRITSSASVKFARAFYEELSRTGHVDSAVTEARLTLKDRASSLEWISPVLYLNADNGKLFKINKRHIVMRKIRREAQHIGGRAKVLVSNRPLRVIIPAVLALLILVPTLFFLLYHQHSLCDNIGLSEGKLCFDPDQRDARDKENAIQAFNNNNFAGAISALKQASTHAPNDAEPRIYFNDEVFRNSPHITFVVGVNFDTNFIGGSRDILQGALLAQNRWNNDHSHPMKLILVIANIAEPDQAGPQTTANITANVANQIINSPTDIGPILGIEGWEASQDTFNIYQNLKQAFPLVSPSSSTHDLNNATGFFRIVPSDEVQAQTSAQFAADRLAPNATVAILNTTGNLYSGNGTQTLESYFQGDLLTAMVNNHKCPPINHCLTIPAPISYVSGDTSSLQNALRTALNSNPALIFFSGYAGDFQRLFPLPTQKNILFIGGDALSIMSDYYKDSLPENVYFTAYASPANHIPALTAFNNDFATTFQTSPGASNGVAGVDTEILLSYDALQVLLQGYLNIGKASGSAGNVTPKNLLLGIQQINEANPLQGLSGKIAFSDSEDSTAPIHKSVVLEHIVNNQLNIVSQQGCLLISCS